MSPKSTAGMMVARSYMIFRFSNVWTAPFSYR